MAMCLPLQRQYEKQKIMHETSSESTDFRLEIPIMLEQSAGILIPTSGHSTISDLNEIIVKMQTVDMKHDNC